MSFTEYKTVEKEIIDHLCGKELRWRYLPGDRVTAQYRGGDEQEMLLVPYLRNQLKKLNPVAITNNERADLVITSSGCCATTRNGSLGCGANRR